jgi:glycosyltransferase involved in cell wall biosynthesis
MTAVHQLLPAAAPYDAITGQAFAWRDLLRTWGHESEIVAEYVHPDLMGTVRQLNRAGRRLVGRGRIVLRYALYSATVDTALRSRTPLALVYHNITPGELVREFNPELAELCDRGRAALERFRGRADALIADSSFNADELRGAGLSEAAVVPLLLELPRTAPRREPNSEPVVVTVGRVVPNKRIEDAIRGFALYQRRHAPEASFVVVGSDVGFESYRQALEVLAARVAARNVFFTGPISS